MLSMLSKNIFYPSTSPRPAPGIPLGASLLFFIFYFFQACTEHPPLGVINVEGEETASLCYVQIPEDLMKSVKGNFILKPEDGSPTVPLQKADSSVYVFTSKPGIKRYRVYALSEKTTYKNTLLKNDSTLTLSTGNKPVLQYVSGLTNVPGRVDSLFIRSGFIHPLWSPDGAVLSCIHPKDHLHHLGLWHPWTKVTFRNRHLDFWNLGDGLATVRHASFNDVVDGPVWSGFEANLLHLEREPAGKLSPVINEMFDVRLWHIPDLDGFLFDYTIQQECATEEPVLLDEYRYGGLGFRATQDWQGENRHYLTSEGKDIDSTDGSRARWGMVWGNTQKGTSTVLFLSHPDNHEFPEPVRIWNRTTNDLFFNFCPIKKRSWTLEPGIQYTRRYRIFVTDRALTPGEADVLWEAFAHPAEVWFEAIVEI